MSRVTKARIVPHCLSQYCGIESLLYLFAYHGAAVLAKEKPSFLINIRNKQKGHALMDVWDRYKHIIMRHIPCDYYELQRSDSHCVVLVYHRDWMKRLISEPTHRQFLERFQYPVSSEPEKALEHLKGRYHKQCPHEIGVFLGYPIHDVRCFVDCPTRECQLVGYWKVFEKKHEAMETFERYDRVRNECVRLLNTGMRPSQVVIKHAQAC